ncbi:membrane protein [Lentilactobacillus fungorum]|uniref:Membrane protein n=1 Tax=Lentilactobacillus fungorum TaxID=2201250 RepID=A0ABQ3VY16_9LACO|nr:ABC transporter permease subunit [Lentilactobacillus fungorum]GHP13603.1 membrane protein [Lentilactobacillus fungorum]
MIDLLRQELYKMVHQKSIQFSPLILFSLMLFVGFASIHTGDLNDYISQGFAAAQWLDILIIIASANIISMEFEHGTIKHLIAQHNQRLLIYLSKMIVIGIYCVVLHLCAFIFAIVVKYAVYGNSYPFSAIYDNHQTVMQNLLTSILSNLFSCLLVVTVVFLIASLSRTSSIAAVVGVLFIFMATAVSRILINTVGRALPSIKWNPGNMFNVAFQFLTPDVYQQSMLTNTQLVIGNLIWAVIFIALGYGAFKRKRI